MPSSSNDDHRADEGGAEEEHHLAVAASFDALVAALAEYASCRHELHAVCLPAARMDLVEARRVLSDSRHIDLGLHSVPFPLTHSESESNDDGDDDTPIVHASVRVGVSSTAATDGTGGDGVRLSCVFGSSSPSSLAVNHSPSNGKKEKNDDADTTKEGKGASSWQSKLESDSSDPLQWFTAAPPQELRRAQKTFRGAASVAVRCSDAKLRVEEAHRTFLRLQEEAEEATSS